MGGGCSSCERRMWSRRISCSALDRIGPAHVRITIDQRRVSRIPRIRNVASITTGRSTARTGASNSRILGDGLTCSKLDMRRTSVKVKAHPVGIDSPNTTAGKRKPITGPAHISRAPRGTPTKPMQAGVRLAQASCTRTGMAAGTSNPWAEL